MFWKWIGRGRNAMAERLAKLEAELATERERRLTIELTERAETELGCLPGTTEEKIELLRSVEAMPEQPRKIAIAMFKASNKIASLAFERIGRGRVWGYERIFMAKVNDIEKRDKCPRSEAMRKARHEYPDEFAAWQYQD